MKHRKSNSMRPRADMWQPPPPSACSLWIWASERRCREGPGHSTHHPPLKEVPPGHGTRCVQGHVALEGPWRVSPPASTCTPRSATGWRTHSYCPSLHLCCPERWEASLVGLLLTTFPISTLLALTFSFPPPPSILFFYLSFVLPSIHSCLSVHFSLSRGPTHCKRPWGWERLRARGEGADRGWDGWMVCITNSWTWVWANSGRYWGTGKPGVLQSIESQRIRHDLEVEQQQHGPNPSPSVCWVLCV